MMVQYVIVETDQVCLDALSMHRTLRRAGSAPTRRLSGRYHAATATPGVLFRRAIGTRV